MAHMPYHMDHYGHISYNILWGMREERNLNRARENYLEYAPQEPIDATRQKGVKAGFCKT